jgi:hypothetical protein
LYIYSVSNSKYFTHGYPEDPRMPIYALYQPVLDCFLVILPDYVTIGQLLAAVLSSRYLLQPVYLNLAENYVQNIIDNEVCHNWTFSNSDRVPTRSLMIDFKLINAERLILCDTIHSLDIEKEKQWVQFCAFWLRFITSTVKFGWWIDLQIGRNSLFGMFESLADPKLQEFSDQVVKLLYLGRDIAVTEQAILTLLEKTGPSMQESFDLYSKNCL